MKYLIVVFTVVVFAFSCKKNDYFIEKEDDHTFCGVEILPFYFQGTIKDVTAGNSLVGFTIHSKMGYNTNYQVYDTITDSTYFVKFMNQMPFDSAYNETHNKIQLRNLSGIIVDSFAIPVSLWIANDTATYDYSF